MSRVIQFEIEAKDPEKKISFYQDVSAGNSNRCKGEAEV